ncbi:MAG: NFACT family protein, partial [Clostridia bacterium]|nr:NFACT family protein [Clostridia bacterium]
MALDGAFLRHIKQEMETRALDARVDKIYQPNKEEIVVGLRTREENFRILFSARANSPRVHFTQEKIENPKQPPMLCMLLRKRLASARLVSIEQPGLERLLLFTFDTVNELGDHVPLQLAMEVMGRYSNVIIVDENGKVLDALKRVDAEMSSERLVLPGVTYHLPPAQDKLCMLEAETEEIVQRLRDIPGDAKLNKALLNVLQGVSPVVCRELEFQVGRGADISVRSMTDNHWDRLSFFLQRLIDTVRSCSGIPFLVKNRDGKPMDFSFMEPNQYGTAALVSQAEGFSRLLDDFYSEKDRQERMRVRQQDLLRLLTNTSERLTRKIGLQQEELAECANREHLRICGDLINANLYAIEKGAEKVSLMNFYDPDCAMLTVKLDPALSASANAQKYYKDYRKAKTAEEKLAEQISSARKELEYIDTVLDEMSRAETEKDLGEIRAELSEQGYIRKNKQKGGAEKPSDPLRFTTTEGYTVLVGRN